MNPGGLRIMVTAWGVASGLAISTWSPASPIVTYNATASAPMGFYRLEHTSRIGVGDYVLSHLPQDMAALADRRRYVPVRVPVLKRVAGGPGARVCRFGARVLVEGRAVVRAFLRDNAGRPLPIWSGCRVLRTGQVFLLSTRNPASFDGRYFGPTSAALIIAKAHPLSCCAGSMTRARIWSSPATTSPMACAFAPRSWPPSCSGHRPSGSCASG